MELHGGMVISNAASTRLTYYCYRTAAKVKHMKSSDTATLGISMNLGSSYDAHVKTVQILLRSYHTVHQVIFARH